MCFISNGLHSRKKQQAGEQFQAMEKIMSLTKEALEKAMKRADALAASNTDGGPFGSVILDAQGAIVGEGFNRVVCTNNPTCHAEMQALRDAGKKHGHWHLKGATLVTSCECCPMCLAGAYAAGVERIIYANTRKDAADIGFDDNKNYEEMAVGLVKLPIERVKQSPFFKGGIEAVVIDAQGTVLGEASATDAAQDDPTALPSVVAIGRATTTLGTFHLPDGCTLLTRKMPHPLGYTAARWAHIEHIVALEGDHGFEGADRAFAPEAIYHDIALPLNRLAQRRIPMERMEDAALLKQTLATFEKWFNDQNKVLY